MQQVDFIYLSNACSWAIQHWASQKQPDLHSWMSSSGQVEMWPLFIVPSEQIRHISSSARPKRCSVLEGSHSRSAFGIWPQQLLCRWLTAGSRSIEMKPTAFPCSLNCVWSFKRLTEVRLVFLFGRSVFAFSSSAFIFRWRIKWNKLRNFFFNS